MQVIGHHHKFLNLHPWPIYRNFPPQFNNKPPQLRKAYSARGLAREFTQPLATAIRKREGNHISAGRTIIPAASAACHAMYGFT